MQPHQYPGGPGAWPQGQSWPDDPPAGYPPVPGQPYAQPYAGGPSYGPGTARPGSVVPLIVGAVGAGLAALALLVAAIMAALVFRSLGAERDEDDAIATILIVWTTVVAALLLVYSLALIVTKRDAGRSGAVWVSAAALPWTSMVAIAITGVAGDNSAEDGGVLSDGFVAAAALVSFGCAGLAFLGMIIAMILLGIPPGRRWLADRVLARSEPLWPPAPLLAAKRRFTLSAFLGMGGCAAQLVLTPLVTNGDDSRDTFLAVFAGILVVLVALPLLLGQWGARLAMNGRRGGANLARGAGVVVVYGIQPFMLLGIVNGLAGVYTDDATLPPAAAGPLGALVTAVVMLALVQYVAGLAALADPRSEVYLRSGGRRAG
jgi:hypothetical protein